MGFGDLAAQSLAAYSTVQELDLDVIRTLRFTAYGSLFGPANGLWYSTSPLTAS